MTSNIVLSSALRSTLNSIQRSEKTIDDVTQRLASGLEVSRAIDKPQNFFTASALRDTASDKARLLDGLGQSIRTVEEALTGIEATERLLNQAEAVVTESKDAILAGEVDPAVFETTVNIAPRPLDQQILQSNPVTYYRLNETAGAIVDYGTLGPVTATRQGGATPGAAALYSNGGTASVDFDGVNDRIRLNDANHINLQPTSARTVELVFNADDVSGRQVIYEEGAGVNGFTIYIDNGSLYFTAEDDNGGNRFADININAPIVAGQTYHAAFIFNGAGGPTNGGGGPNTFSGYLDGAEVGSVVLAGDVQFPSHSGDTGIGAAVDGVQFHDGEAGAGFNFDGRISDVAIYNTALEQRILENHSNSLESSTSQRYFNEEYNELLNQLDRIAIDAEYRGINLLGGETLRTNFNESQTSFLLTEGQDFSAKGLGLSINFDFNDLDEIEDILEDIRAAKKRVREFGFTLTNDLSVIQIRTDFTRDSIITNEAGADDLTVADLNREGANLLASQTRQTLGVTALGLAAISTASTLRLF